MDREIERLGIVRAQLSERVAELRSAADRLGPLDIHSRMDAIRAVAAAHGLAALEGLAHRSAQLALLPGHRVTVDECLSHMGEAIGSTAQRDRQTILAALAVRLQ